MKTAKTFAEKILNALSGSIVSCEPDIFLSHDNSARIGRLFEKIKGGDVVDSRKLVVVLDRKMGGTTDELVRDYNSIHRFMKEQRVEHFFDCDKGICHQILTEYLKEGMVVTGSDSHTCTAGAFNCFAVGLNKTETAVLWKTGRMWFRVPESIKITLKNALPAGVYAKDVALWIMGMLSRENVSYQSVEFHGDGVRSLTIADRMTIANVAAEIGLKNIVFPPDDTLADYFGNYAVQGIWADENAVYAKEFEIDLAEIKPLVMATGAENEVKTVTEWGALQVQQGLIGACASGRLEDLQVVARILKNRHIAPGFQLSVVPASREIYLKAIKEGIIDILYKAGVSILGASCGPCLGSSHMIMADTKRFISTTNSNSMNRLSVVGVEKYIASPATVAMTALKGVLSTEIENMAVSFPYHPVISGEVVLEEYDDRLNSRIWNYADMDNISCEQLFAEEWTYHIPVENRQAMISHLLSGVDLSFAERVKAGDIIIAGNNFGCRRLIKHAAAGLAEAGVKVVIVKSASRGFFRMAANHGLLIVIAPAFVEKYRQGNTVEIDWEQGCLRLNREEFPLPRMDEDFLQMIREGGILPYHQK